MKWLLGVLLLDAALAVWLLTSGGRSERADFVFISPGEHHFLDPQRISWRHDFRVVECLFEPLARFRLPEMVIEPAAAQRWDVSDDGLTYTFHLRDEARWSNGDPVTAGDFVYAWRRALLPDLAADYSQLLFCIEGAEDFFNWRAGQLKDYAQGTDKSVAAAESAWARAQERFDQTVAVHALDPLTLRVKLRQPLGCFLELCAFATFMPVHAKSVRSQVSLSAESGLLLQDPYWTRPDRLICNGPYTLARRRFKRDLLMEANPRYWNSQAVPSRSILERIVANPKLALLMYESGGADFLPEIPSASPLAADLVAQNRTDVHLVPAAGTYFYNFNCNPALADGTPNPLSDSRVRRALALAVDRRVIVEKVSRLRQPIALTFVPPGSLPGYEPPMEAGAGFDPAQARALLAQAGYSDGRNLRGLSILYNTGHGHEHVAQAIKKMWEENLGVVVTLAGVESKVFGARLKRQDYSIARAGWFGDYRDPTTFLDKFLSYNGNNDAAWKNPEYDALMEQAAGIRDFAQRMEAYRQAEAMMLRAQPIMPIYQYAEVKLYDPERVENLWLNAWSFRRFDRVVVRGNTR